MDLPPYFLAVLEAMTRQDPDPPVNFDNPAAAVLRRLPDLSYGQIVDVLETLKALGLVDLPFVRALTTTTLLGELQHWITPEGWEALGMEANAGASRGN